MALFIVEWCDLKLAGFVHMSGENTSGRREGNACCKNQAFCITPTNYNVIKFDQLSITVFLLPVPLLLSVLCLSPPPISLKGPTQPHLCFCLHASIGLFGACRNEGNYCETKIISSHT